ncbi:AraC family transcriptional regulator [Exilibacterium tricleocarpae]|uniref:AraC family transcriptional regulator n=1 Tax=Exilibacterium tricleocarpae TaxID=2591008 RepID=A0A545TZ97_9GAMM|nr:AraC family transcriptional regulator [Exilibacterium tricleocarpae]TQV82538.1 AraC family transcriptional regulator [Exilibacterium tricleocarpae]
MKNLQLLVPDWMLGSKDDKSVANTLPAALVDTAASFGMDGEQLLADTGICATQLHQPQGRISLRAYLRLCTLVLKKEKSPALCLRFGERVNISALGVLGPSLLSCNTLGEALELAIRYRETLGFPIDMRMDIDSRFCSIVIEAPFRLLIPTLFLRASLCCAFAGIRQNSRFLLNGNFNFASIGFNFPPAADDNIISDFFECPIDYRSKTNCARFERELLDLPIRYANPSAKKIAQQKCEQTLASLYRSRSIPRQAARLLIAHLQNPPHLTEVAARLNLSPRSLSRQLQNDGLTYQTLLSQLRSRSAQLLLEESDLSTEEIAYTIGFTDAANFRRAFKKWNQITPSAYRLQQRAQATDTTPA